MIPFLHLLLAPAEVYAHLVVGDWQLVGRGRAIGLVFGWVPG